MKVLFWIIALPIIAVAMAFAVSNPEPVTISLWPLAYRIEVPLYIAVSGALFLGFMVGITWGWIGSLRARRRMRAETKRADVLREENTELRHQLARAESAAHALPPDDPAESTLRHIVGGVGE